MLHDLWCSTLPQIWKKSSFGKRRRLLKIMLKFIIENQETICRYIPAWYMHACPVSHPGASTGLYPKLCP